MDNTHRNRTAAHNSILNKEPILWDDSEAHGFLFRAQVRDKIETHLIAQIICIGC